MDDWLTFALERYNYWIVIVLMMTGLYIVFARGNLVKKIVGLNIFQTSVFIFYITIGKITGGTAPIYMAGELDHGGGHGDEHGAEHGEGALHDAPAGEGGNALPAGGHSAEQSESLHAKVDNAFPDNDMKSAREMVEAGPAGDAAQSLHAAPHGDLSAKIANNTLAHADKTPPAAGFDVAHAAPDALHAGDAANALDGAHGAIEAVIYSNPLPHVLILTAIVVGVATTAVGLALAVRIREAYGTIEEDELEAADEIAEFGHAAGASA